MSGGKTAGRCKIDARPTRHGARQQRPSRRQSWQVHARVRLRRVSSCSCSEVPYLQRCGSFMLWHAVSALIPVPPCWHARTDTVQPPAWRLIQIHAICRGNVGEAGGILLRTLHQALHSNSRRLREVSPRQDTVRHLRIHPALGRRWRRASESRCRP